MGLVRASDDSCNNAAFRGAYPFRAEFCAPAKGWEKGSVEGGVKYVRNLVFRPRLAVESWAALNALLITELRGDDWSAPRFVPCPRCWDPG